MPGKHDLVWGEGIGDGGSTFSLISQSNVLTSLGVYTISKLSNMIEHETWLYIKSIM